MYNIVNIGNKAVPMLSMASVDIYYRNIFHEDAIKIQTKESDEGDLINFVLRMGFIMAKFAEIRDRKEMNKLNEDNFVEWLDQFDRADYFNALPDIKATYEGQSITESESKKKNPEQPEG